MPLPVPDISRNLFDLSGYCSIVTGAGQGIGLALAEALAYAGSDGREVHWDMIRVALMSVANTAIFPLQDLLGLGTEARMNVPGTASGNWEFRALSTEFALAVPERMAKLCESYERIPADIRRTE